MTRQEIIIEGKNFSDLGSFYDEIDRVLTKDLDWKTGHNLDGFNDLLRGGFGVYEYEEPIRLTWKNAAKSKNDLGSIYADISEIISSHEHIEFSVED